MLTSSEECALTEDLPLCDRCHFSLGDKLFAHQIGSLKIHINSTDALPQDEQLVVWKAFLHDASSRLKGDLVEESKRLVRELRKRINLAHPRHVCENEISPVSPLTAYSVLDEEVKRFRGELDDQCMGCYDHSVLFTFVVLGEQGLIAKSRPLQHDFGKGFNHVLADGYRLRVELILGIHGTCEV